LSEDEIAANQLQVDSSLEAINRIAQTTTFQGRKLLDGSLDFITQGGNNFSEISGLKVDQANLGNTGSVSVDVEVSARATRASLTVGGINTGAEGTGAITLNNVAADAEATTQSLTTGAGADYQIKAADGGVYDGTAGNDVTVNIATGETTATGQASTAVQSTAGGGGFSVSVKAGSELYDGSNGNDIDLVVEAGNTATAQAVSNAQDVNGVTGAITVSAKAGGDYDGVAGNAIDVVVQSGTTGGAAATAAVATNTLTITVDDSGDQSLEDIKAALEADANFQDEFELTIADGEADTLFRADGSDDLASFQLDGATSGADDAATATFDGSQITITVDDNTTRNLSEVKTAVESLAVFSQDFRFNLGTDGTFATDGTDDTGTVDLTGGTNEVAEATLVDDVLSITVSDAQAYTISAIDTALQNDTDFDAFEFTINTNANFAADGSDDVTDEALNSGSDGTDTTVTDEITITAPAGNNRNGNVTINTDASVTTPSVALDDDGNITVTVNDSSTTAMSAIVDAINDTLGSEGYSAELTTNDGDGTFDPTTDNFATTAITGSEAGGITADVVFQLQGNNGSEVFNVSAGTSVSQLVEQINLVGDATGITAESEGGEITLSSNEFGASEFVDLQVISEGTGGEFTAAVGSGQRSNGSDVSAKVNGIDANVDGTKISVNTATLDLSLEISSGFQGTASFDITGGGAQFQLGPDVVSNQQARIGIDSVSTARLGGATGKLFELGSGQAAALATDPGRASQIVDEAIGRVTSLRGRLGAFQRTTLDSNIASLSDTVANLQEAESSIRDADFAAESAALTRSQILVQSGTNVLSLANQNPQNVLSLLR
jgi:flagellin